MKHVSMYVDGACKGNHKKGGAPGGFAAVLVFGSATKAVVGFRQNTTNQRMEQTAAIAGLSALKEPCEVTVYTDSQYLVGTMTQSWKRRANLDNWKQLDKLCLIHRVTWEWVKGHAGNPMNEEANRLAQRQASIAEGE